MRGPNILSKELMTPYQRWEMASLEESGKPEAGTQEEVTPEDAAELLAEQVVEPPLPAPTAEEIAAIHDEARQLGYVQGMEQGNANGYEEGYAAGMAQGRMEMDEILQHFRHIANTFSSEVAHCSEMIAPDMLDLALDFTKAMLKTALKVRPELVLPLISAALQTIPILQQPALLYLSPEDAVLVREHMGAELLQTGWRIADDIDMERGGCRIETPSNHIDASLPSRWQRLATSLSKESDWLGP
ncbi:flagellar assembly protein FliH [Herbaspirillum sp. RTI4]|uniref:flagellar assembly protein FliH n=1 Tax=Herbaspirillum sp. RTI4 TaxID=3048640 RepID=UPI002AB4C09D|nr:flagellar assembly protein FliH [Herbaspirillum sp. RTI4]MDY7578317.1 flagellar assembly protein FliH [Herbaspirillum sp. RTI4]MEA9981190.1 flagellar assembly protein FliH [Herbaspirillum sp. RTI4]